MYRLFTWLPKAEDFYQNDYPEEEDYDDVLDGDEGKLIEGVDLNVTTC